MAFLGPQWPAEEQQQAEHHQPNAPQHVAQEVGEIDRRKIKRGQHTGQDQHRRHRPERQAEQVDPAFDLPDPGVIGKPAPLRSSQMSCGRAFRDGDAPKTGAVFL